MSNNNFCNNKNIKGCNSDPSQCSPCCCYMGQPCRFKSAYGTFIGFQPRTLEANELALLDASLSVSPVGITFTPGSPTVTVLNAGIYRITYMVISNILTSYGLVINGVFLPNSGFSNRGGSSMTGIATISLVPGSTLGITTSGADLITGTNTVLDILRIS